ncbi:ABC-2 type transport system permease protein [Bacillus sp. OK838]|nr:ABC-2 type transport system permease protein [Bacillus sp. OK838]
MSSRITWFNQELIIYIFRSTGWIGFLYFVGLIFALPLEMLTIILNENNEYVEFDNLFSSQQMIQYVLVIVIPVLFAIFLFRFLQMKQASDFIHSLPITRRNIFFHMIGTGMGFIVLPILLTGSILILFHSAIDIERLYTIPDIWSWMGITFILEALIFSVAVLIGMVTGLSALQGLLTYIFLALPVGLFVLFAANVKFLIAGFSADYYLSANMNAISPLLAATEMEKITFFSVDILIYSILTLLFLLSSLFLYERRKLEHVSQAFVFPKIKPLFKFGLTICMMLLTGLYFSGTTGKPGWIFFGYIVGSLLGYYLGEIVLQKTWRIRLNLKGYTAFTVFIIVLALILKIDPIQYMSKIPDEKMINQIYIGDAPLFFDDGTLDNAPTYLKEKENKEAIRLLHQQIIEKGKKVSIGELDDGKSIFLMYELKNGRRLAREYHLQNYDLYLPLLAKIYESSEYKKTVNELLNVSAEDVSKIKITASGQVEKSVTITDGQQLDEAVQALSEDLNNQSFTQMTSSFGEYASIDILLNNNKIIYLNWDSSYTQFSKWMENSGQAEEARLMADDISYILVAKTDPKIYNSNSESKLVQQIEQKPNRMKINTSPEIDLAIDNAQIDWGGEYSAAFYYKDSRDVDIKSFSGEHVPGFILDHFNE